LIQTENAFKGSLQFKDGLPKTTTGDEFNHGYGVSSIKMIAEKYGGSLNTRAEDNVFYLNILIPMEGKEERQ
jgi:sensor histidine kinase regulating citrate/malate metabolism